MLRTRIITGLLAASVVVGATACSDTTEPSRTPVISAPTPPASVTLYGVIHNTGRDPERSLTLTMPDGSEVALDYSAETAPLARVDGDEVEVHGFWDGEGAFDVNDFVVRRVNGEAVIDGVLIDLGAEGLPDLPSPSYALRLADGSISPVLSPSDDMLAHIGARMWVDRADDGRATAYGIIAE